ncbi:MAG TPA: phosphate ABC transporter substrate-binding protein PstS [bacterium]|nr:phosphate ABC transporter substrate-binding protein PstS [bacterium]
MRRRQMFTCVLLAGILAAGCGPRTVREPDEPRTGAAVTLNGAGATFPYPLYSRWAQVYERETRVRINYQSIGSGGGIRQFIARTVDFGASDGPMTDELMAQAGGRPLHIPTVAGAVVPIYNVPGAPEGLRFTPAALAGIYLGTVTRWNDPRIAEANPGLTLPGAEIVVVHRSDGSGTTRIWTNFLSKVSREWQARAGEGTSLNWPAGIGAKGNEGVAEVVRRTPNAVGYAELAYALTAGIPYGSVRNRAGRFVVPSLESTTAAVAGALDRIPDDFRIFITDPAGPDAYPIAGFTWILIRGEQADPRKGRALVEFLRWALQDGQQDAPALGYAPLPAGLVERVQQALRTVTAEGRPLLDGGR